MVFTALKSLRSDFFNFTGRVGRLEFLSKLAFWQVALPALLGGVVMWLYPAIPIILEIATLALLLCSCAFLFPVTVCRSRDAGLPVPIFLIAATAFISIQVYMGVLWPYLSLLSALAILPSRTNNDLIEAAIPEREPLILSQDYRVFPK
jgi:uncharacterized membrane protein YhaH (DUF805 family)